jgi:hypothetical protein
VIEGLKNLQPDSGSSSVDLLTQISQQLATFTNASQPSVVLTFPDRSPFHAPISALLTNTLWLLSLIVSLSCALLATLLQQWARRYLLITQNHGSKLHDRARVRSFFAEGVTKYHLSKGCRGTPRAPSHICLFLFLGTPHLHLRHPSHPLFPNPPAYLVLWICLFGVDTHADPSSQQSISDPSINPGLVLLYARSADGQMCIGLFILD